MMAGSVNDGGGSDVALPAITDSFTTDEEEYECKICYNNFDLDRRIPKLLSCSHTFCQECLEALHSGEGGGWRIGCPVCRHRTPVRDYSVQSLPNNSRLSELRLFQNNQNTNSSKTEQQTGPSVCSATSQHTAERCESWKHVAFTTGCACALMSSFSTVVLVFVGLVFVHNFHHTGSPVGPVCLLIASVLSPFSLILTWLMCMLKYQPESQNVNSPTSNIM